MKRKREPFTTDGRDLMHTVLTILVAFAVIAAFVALSEFGAK